MVEKSPFSKIDHVGIIVRDIEKAKKHYQLLGIGPFVPAKVVFLERILRGKSIDPDSIMYKEEMAKLGPIKIQLIEPVVGRPIMREFLETKGEGASHISFHVDDIDKEEAKLVAKGLTVLYRSRYESGGGSTSLVTDKVGGVIFELEQL